ncbi:MAG: phospholipase D family protein [Rhizorhabdus sp.]|uniref:phospholipase D family protein n=1 Tax=Rhizorhabdus sp. TaxID=1968843 RepID=UPI001B61AF29|nr:phospholipase D family protein [Rhizorhabdus sp.]MBP8232104.1 phospholipase D family protein [Rhizorhabdus sp.]
MNDRSVEADLPLTGARATFVAGTDLTSATMYILGGARLRCAVAYWGAGAERRFDPATLHGAKLICNLGGATDPDTIRKLMATGAQVRMDRNLHAKVYISDRGAVISSANQSANGLGDGNGRQPLWREAGVVFPRPDETV